MIAPKSAIEAVATTSRPKLELMLFESSRTSTITPSEVATRTIETDSVDFTNPPAFRPTPMTIAMANERATPSEI